MKKIGFTFCLLFLGVLLIGQSSNQSRKSSKKEDKRWYELEINSVFLLQEIFGAGNPDDLQEAYLVGFKMGKGNVGWRVGLGAGFNLRKEKESLVDLRDVTAYTLRARVGIEWRKQLLERWQLISGLDGVVESNFQEDVTTSSFDKISTRDEEFVVGGGPLLGIRFWLNEKVSLSTETGFQALYVRKVEAVDSQNLPDFDSKRVTFEYPLRFSPPVNLYLIIRF